ATVTAEEVAVAEPAALVAVTATFTVEPTSAAPRMYVAPVPTFAQAPPQRCHWYVYEIGAVPLHVPGLAVSVAPSLGVPPIVGRAVFAGGTGGAPPDPPR